MADKILVLVDGRSVQLGSPFDLCKKPAHPFTAETISKREMISGRLKKNTVVTTFGNFNLRDEFASNFKQANDGQQVSIALAPSTVGLSHSHNGVLIEDIRFELTHWSAILLDNQHRLKVHLPNSHEFKRGDKVSVDLKDCDYILF